MEEIVLKDRPIVIRSAFRELIPPLGPEEYAGLENSLKEDGCRDALVVWERSFDADELYSQGYGTCKDDGCPYGKSRERVPADEWEVGDGNWQCPKCGYGIAPAEAELILLDGHNRHEICTRLSIPYETSILAYGEVEDESDAMLWIIDNQMGRRNLADIDRIALQCRRKDIVTKIAASSKRETLRIAAESHVSSFPEKGEKGFRKQSNEMRANLPSSHWKPPKAAKPKNVNTRTELAKAAGVGERTFDAGLLVLKEASKEEIQAIRRKEKSIHAVAKQLKEKKQRNQREKQRLEAAENAPAMDKRIIVGDFREQADKIPDGSLSLIFTDPPYDRTASKMLPDLAAFAEAKLADGGSLLCYVGQTQIPSAIDALRTRLRYWWTVACLHAGGATVMREYGINAHWKAVLWFVKGTRDNNSIMVDDVMSGGQEKTHHDWQQAESEAAYWIENLCPENGTVCDPFLGGGTTAAAAAKLGRRWVGFEINENTAKVASARLCA